MVLISAVVVLVAAIAVGALSYATYIRNQTEDALALSSPSTNISPPAVLQAPVRGVVEKAAQLLADGQLDEASKALSEADLLMNRLSGKIAWKRGDTATALAKFQEALRLSPNTTEDLANLASVEAATGRAVEAVALLKRARELAPDDVYIENRYLLARLQAGDAAGVRTEVTTALELSPENGLAGFAFAAAALELAAGQFGNGASFLHAAKARLPSATFAKLLEQPPISSYAARPELQSFFPRPLPGE